MLAIAFINQKGGVGKTTSAVEVASRFAKSGKRTLCIDADPQGNMTFIFGLNPDKDGQFTLKDIFMKKCTIKDAAIKCDEGVFLIPNNILMSNADRMFVDINSMKLLKNSLKDVQHDYDVCIIDSPPTLGIINWNVLIASDYIIVPVNANALSIQGLKALSETVGEVQEDANKDLKILGLLVNRFNPRTKLGKEALPDLEMIADKFLNTSVFDTKIRQSVVIEDSQASRNSTAKGKKTPISKDYDLLFDEINNRLNGEKK